MKEAHIAKLSDALDAAVARVETEFGPLPTRKFTWSERLTTCIGQASLDGGIRLSAPIFRRMYADKGIDEVVRQAVDTYIHEACHLYNRRNGGRGHDRGWYELMWRMGYKPGENRYHHESCGRDLFASKDIQRYFYVGARIEFQHWQDGYTIYSTVVKHNTKTFKVVDDTDGTRYNVPWNWAVENATVL